MVSKYSVIKNNILNLLTDEGNSQTSIKGLRIARRNHPTEFLPCFYGATCIFVIQGKKQTIFGTEEFFYEEGKYVVSCTDVPALGRVAEATPEKPCVAVILELDSLEISKLILETKIGNDMEYNKQSLAAADIDESLLDAFCRLTDLLTQPKAQQDILAPMIKREIYYRLLTGPLGGQLRLINTKGTTSNQISDAISLLKENFREKLNIEELARDVNMAPSSFYRNFKKVTQVSPLQYLKQLRLYEAQRLMLSGNHDAASACYEVGYESPTQFSREYKKMFGNPPRTDIRKLVAV